MVTLNRLALGDVDELHRRLGRRWRLAGNDPAAKRIYRIMCHVYVRSAWLHKHEELHRVYRDMMSA